MSVERDLQIAATATPCVRTPPWHEQLVAVYLSIPVVLEPQRGFERVGWISVRYTECFFCLKTFLKYPAKHAQCYWAAPARKEHVQVRSRPRLPLGSASSQEEEHQPLSHQIAPEVSSISWFMGSVTVIVGSQRTHTHPPQLVEQAEERHLSYPGKQSS